jgi:protein-S-isoprenylcysteine O-methyltransferase Ste14
VTSRFRQLLRRLNDLPVFDLGRWPAPDIIGRVVGCLLMIAFLAQRILQLPNTPGYISEVRWAKPWFDQFSTLPRILVAPAIDLEGYYKSFGYSKSQILVLWGLMLFLWIVVTGVLLAYLLAFVTRANARFMAKGFMETAFPLIVSALPYAIVTTGSSYREWFPERSQIHMDGLYGIVGLLIAGNLINLIGLLGLRRGFTVVSEARVFVRSGIYRWIRHPLYTSHFIIFLGTTLLFFHVVSVALYLVFVVGQIVRARIEERKMTAVFPEYEDYRQSTGMFFPRFFERGSPVSSPA